MLAHCTQRDKEHKMWRRIKNLLAGRGLTDQGEPHRHVRKYTPPLPTPDHLKLPAYRSGRKRKASSVSETRVSKRHRTTQENGASRLPAESSHAGMKRKADRSNATRHAKRHRTQVPDPLHCTISEMSPLGLYNAQDRAPASESDPKGKRRAEETSDGAGSASEDQGAMLLRRTDPTLVPNVNGSGLADRRTPDRRVTGRKLRDGQDTLGTPPARTPRRARQPSTPARQTLTEVDQEDLDDNVSQSAIRPTPTRLNAPGLSEFQNGAAQRHAAANKLFPGVWARGEETVYRRLTLLGYEALIPRNWQLDFKTLPLSLFDVSDHPDNRPLLRPCMTNEFRSVRALRDLIDTGKAVRDKSITSPSVFAQQEVVRKAVKRYLDYCTTDADTMQAHNPTHILIARDRDEITRSVLWRLSQELHSLAGKARDVIGIPRGMRTPFNGTISLSESGDVQWYDESDPNNIDIAPIVGIACVSSLVIIFTLNGHFADADLYGINGTDVGTPLDSPDTGVKFIAQFDFSDPGYDVWNALSIAIVASHIRNTMNESAGVKLEEGKTKISDPQTWDDPRRAGMKRAKAWDETISRAAKNRDDPDR